jgi:4-alpha-glucanotransferase
VSERRWLRALAARLGVLDGYHSALDGRWVETSNATREALVEAMGFDAGSEASARRALACAGDGASAGEGSGPPGALERCVGVDEQLGDRRRFGLWANLYSIRSGRNWGFGNFGDLLGLVRLAAAHGAAFVGLNPLHALAHRPGRSSPYTPESRLFRNPLYLDPEAIPELPRCPEAQERMTDPELLRRVAQRRRADHLDPPALAAELDRVLRPLHARFVRGDGADADARRRDFAWFRTREGRALVDFATFQALAGFYEAKGRGRDWRSWPPEYRCPDDPAVVSFRERHRDTVDFHAWLQFELDRQLGTAAEAAREAGLAIGLYTDLALGSDPGGADAWAFQDQLVFDASIGAPPDAFSRLGQDWGLPPLDPHALRRSAYAFFVRLLRAGFRHAGALRIDHAMGLERLFWIPRGRPPAEGAYVAYPRDEMLAIVARESRRHEALVIGEDLGTLPEGFSDALVERNILSSRVLLFEREETGAFRPASSYPRGCLVTANTHDLPTLAALEHEEDLELRRRVGQLPDDTALAEARAERTSLREALRARVEQDGYLDDGGLAVAVTRFLAATPASLLGISLDDLAGESEPINLPGVSPDRHPSWIRRMRVPLEDLASRPLARAMLAAVPAQRRAPASSSPPR